MLGKSSNLNAAKFSHYAVCPTGIINNGFSPNRWAGLSVWSCPPWCRPSVTTQTLSCERRGRWRDGKREHKAEKREPKSGWEEQESGGATENNKHQIKQSNTRRKGYAFLTTCTCTSTHVHTYDDIWAASWPYLTSSCMSASLISLRKKSMSSSLSLISLQNKQTYTGTRGTKETRTRTHKD